MALVLGMDDVLASELDEVPRPMLEFGGVTTRIGNTGKGNGTEHRWTAELQQVDQ